MELLEAIIAFVVLFDSTNNVECSTFFDDLFSEKLFTDTPPEGYDRRTSLNDCVDRFHSQGGTSRPYTTVFNGDPVEPGEYSAFGAIGWTRSSLKIEYLCGGTLITLNFLLTAAHCAEDGNHQPPDTVRLGDVDLSRSDDDQNAQQIAIKRFLKHQDYRASRSYHDIALIELERDVKPGLFVCSACLWTGMDLNFDSLTVMGFGTTDAGNDLSPVLLKAKLAPLKAEECIDQYPKHRKIKEGILASQFCAAAPTRDACPGDSGGPILVDLIDFDRNKQIPFVAGIISIGTGCGEGSMGLYTRVASYIDWIQTVTGASFDPIQCAQKTECSTQYKDTNSSVLYPPGYDFRVILMNDDSDVAICGGTLIDYRHVITSADCVLGISKPTFILHRSDRINISEITVHPQSHMAKSNLAIIMLAQFFNFKAILNSARPACLWQKSSIPEKEVFVSVTGLVYHNKLVVNASIAEDDKCNEGLICAMNMENLVPETCVYELGGPISNSHSTTEFPAPFLYGVNTEGHSCGGRENRFKAVATAQHYTWIESVVLKRIVEASDSKVSYLHEEHFVDSPCRPATGGVLGRCAPAENCRRLLSEHRSGLAQIKTCLFEKYRTIVCCPLDYLNNW